MSPYFEKNLFHVRGNVISLQRKYDCDWNGLIFKMNNGGMEEGDITTMESAYFIALIHGAL